MDNMMKEFERLLAALTPIRVHFKMSDGRIAHTDITGKNPFHLGEVVHWREGDASLVVGIGDEYLPNYKHLRNL